MIVISAEKISQWLVKALVLLTAVYMAIAPQGNSAILLPIKMCGLVIVFFLAFCLLREGKIKKSTLLNFLLLAAVTVFGMIWYSVSLNIDNLQAILCVFGLLILVSIADKIKIDRSLLTFLYCVTLLCAVVQLIYSRTSYAYLHDGHEIDMLTLGLDNPNKTAAYLFLIYSVLLSTLQGRKMKIVPILLSAGLLWLMFLTRSRAVVAAAIVMAILTVRGNTKKIPAGFFLLCCAVPFVFVFAYMHLFENNLQLGEIMEKDVFSGRQEVFTEYLSYMGTAFTALFGNMEKTIFHNAHNGPLAVFATVGLAGGFFYFSILLESTANAWRKADNPVANVALVAILSCFLHASAEAVLMLGTFPGVTFMFLIYLLANAPKALLSSNCENATMTNGKRE